MEKPLLLVVQQQNRYLMMYHILMAIVVLQRIILLWVAVPIIQLLIQILLALHGLVLPADYLKIITTVPVFLHYQ